MNITSRQNTTLRKIISDFLFFDCECPLFVSIFLSDDVSVRLTAFFPDIIPSPFDINYTYYNITSDYMQVIYLGRVLCNVSINEV